MIPFPWLISRWNALKFSSHFLDFSLVLTYDFLRFTEILYIMTLHSNTNLASPALSSQNFFLYYYVFKYQSCPFTGEGTKANWKLCMVVETQSSNIGPKITGSHISSPFWWIYLFKVTLEECLTLNCLSECLTSLNSRNHWSQVNPSTARMEEGKSAGHMTKGSDVQQLQIILLLSHWVIIHIQWSI